MHRASKLSDQAAHNTGTSAIQHGQPYVNSFTPISAGASHSCSEPNHMAHQLCSLHLNIQFPQIRPPDVRPPAWIASLNITDSETFHYMEY